MAKRKSGMVIKGVSEHVGKKTHKGRGSKRGSKKAAKK